MLVCYWQWHDRGGATEVLITSSCWLTLRLNLSNVIDNDMTWDGGGATEVLVIYSYCLILSVFVLIREYQ